MRQSRINEIDNILSLSYDGIVIKVGDIRIVRNGEQFCLFSLISGNCLIKDFYAYYIHDKKYIQMEKIDKLDRQNDMHIIYSIKQNKIWAIPKAVEIKRENGLTLFIDNSGEYKYDIAIFSDSSGELLWRLQLVKPAHNVAKSLASKQVSRCKMLIITITHTDHWNGWCTVNAKILFKWYSFKKQVKTYENLKVTKGYTGIRPMGY